MTSSFISLPNYLSVRCCQSQQSRTSVNPLNTSSPFHPCPVLNPNTLTSRFSYLLYAFALTIPSSIPLSLQNIPHPLSLRLHLQKTLPKPPTLTSHPGPSSSIVLCVFIIVFQSATSTRCDCMEGIDISFLYACTRTQLCASPVTDSQ